MAPNRPRRSPRGPKASRSDPGRGVPRAAWSRRGSGRRAGVPWRARWSPGLEAGKGAFCLRPSGPSPMPGWGRGGGRGEGRWGAARGRGHLPVSLGSNPRAAGRCWQGLTRLALPFSCSLLPTPRPPVRSALTGSRPAVAEDEAAPVLPQPRAACRAPGSFSGNTGEGSLY